MNKMQSGLQFLFRFLCLAFLAGSVAHADNMRLFAYLPAPTVNFVSGEADNSVVLFGEKSSEEDSIIISGDQLINISDIEYTSDTGWQVVIQDVQPGDYNIRVNAVDIFGNRTYSRVQAIRYDNDQFVDPALLGLVVIHQILLGGSDFIPVDASSPVSIFSSQPSLQLVVNASNAVASVYVQGSGQEFNTSDQCELSGINQSIQATQTGKRIEINVDLMEGVNTINCSFLNEEGISVNIPQLRVVHDITPPKITVSKIDQHSSGQLQGTATDLSNAGDTLALRISATDNFRAGTLNVYWNDELIKKDILEDVQKQVDVDIDLSQPDEGQQLRIESFDIAGNRSEVRFNVSVVNKPEVLGRVMNYPNPMKAQDGTTIQYELSTAAEIRLVIIDMAARKVVEQFYPSGFEGGYSGINRISWDGRDQFGEPVGSGLYMLLVYHNDECLGSSKILVINQ